LKRKYNSFNIAQNYSEKKPGKWTTTVLTQKGNEKNGACVTFVVKELFERKFFDPSETPIL
jgi:hypothetical protein